MDFLHPSCLLLEGGWGVRCGFLLSLSPTVTAPPRREVSFLPAHSPEGPFPGLKSLEEAGALRSFCRSVLWGRPRGKALVDDAFCRALLLCF